MKRRLVSILVVAVVLSGAVVVALVMTRSTQTSFTNQQAAPPPQQPIASLAEPEPRASIFSMKVIGRKIVAGPATLRVSEGDEVTIKITADEAEEFHLHGYDKSLQLEKDIESELTFTASLTGRFPFELERSGAQIGTLEVLPE